MRTSARFRASLAAVGLMSLACAHSFGQSNATVPVGCMTYTLTSGATISFGVPVLRLPTLTSTAATVTSNTLGVADSSWTPNQFVSGGSVYFAAIRSGAQAGRTLLVLGNTANTLTLDTEDTPLDAAGFAVSATVDNFELFQGDTLGSLFGSTPDGTGYLSSGLKGGTSTSNADSIQLFDGNAFVTYFFSTTVGSWVMVNGGNTNRNGLILYPDDGMLLKRRGPNGTLTLLGRVPATRLLTKVPGGTSSATAIRFPADTTLGGLNFGSPGTWIAGSSSSSADTVGVWTGSKWDTYYKNLSNRWIKTNGGSADQSALVIRSGTCIRITKKGSATGSASFLGQALPYGL